jgi:hypothetical protein
MLSSTTSRMIGTMTAMSEAHAAHRHRPPVDQLYLDQLAVRLADAASPAAARGEGARAGPSRERRGTARWWRGCSMVET